MQLHGEQLVLTRVPLEDAPRLVPAFNGDKPFNQWSGHASDRTVEQIRADMLVTLHQPGGMVCVRKLTSLPLLTH